MTAAQLDAYWASCSDDRQPVLTSEQAGLADAEWALGWE